MANEAFEGPWVWPNGLVPQTELDIERGETEEAKREYRKMKADRDRLEKLYAEAQADLTDVRAARDQWRTSYIKSETALAEANNRITALTGPNYAAPSLPAVDSPDDLTPEQWRWVATAAKVSLADYPWENATIVIHRLADRLEREQAEKAKRDKVAQVVAEAVDNIQFKLDAHELEQVTQAVLDDPRITVSLNEASVAGDAF